MKLIRKKTINWNANWVYSRKSASIIIYMHRYQFKYISFVFNSVKCWQIRLLPLTADAASAEWAMPIGKTTHHTGISWASVPGVESPSQPPHHAACRVPFVYRLKSKGAGIGAAAAADARDDYQTGVSSDRGVPTISADNTRSRSANWAYCSCCQPARADCGDRSISQSVVRIESSVRQIRYSNHH